MVDARLPDGSRVNAIIPPLALDGPSLSIRRFGTGPLAANQLVQLKSVFGGDDGGAFLRGESQDQHPHLRGTGAGKTTFLNILSQYIPRNERIVTIEDAAELRLAQENIVRLETRPPNIEGQGAIRQRQLLINCLRMRPDRIIMGEVRGEEAFDMLQAMNTGHEGSMTTIHANTARDAISRLESMVAMSNMNLPEKSVRQQIASAITIVVQATRMSDGTRKVTSVAEITGMEESVISMQEIFTFEKKGIGPDGKVIGVFLPTRIRPRSLNGFAFRVSSCRRSCSSAKLRSIRRKGGQQLWIDHRLTFLGVFSVIALVLVAVSSRASEQAKQVHATLDSALATDRQEDREALVNLRKSELFSTIPGSIGGWISSSWRRGSRPCSIRPISNGAREPACRYRVVLCGPGLSGLPAPGFRSHGFAGRLADGLRALFICAL